MRNISFPVIEGFDANWDRISCNTLKRGSGLIYASEPWLLRFEFRVEGMHAITYDYHPSSNVLIIKRNDMSTYYWRDHIFQIKL